MLETRAFFGLSSILIVFQNLCLARGTPVEKWIEQQQDHFDLFNDKTWSMRYYENNEFYHQSGPIFIEIGGESPITLYDVRNTSLVYEMAEAFGAMIYYTEHRYYGKSHPVPDTNLENLRYLSVSQALADIAWFIGTKKKELNNFNAFTIVFGCSYAGNLAAWMRVAYPDVVHGALASSAPIYVKADFHEYYEYIENSIRKYDETCAMHIKEAFSAVEELLDSPANNSIKLENDFDLYTAEFSQSSEVSYLMLRLANIFARAVIHNEIEMNGKTSIENLCISMTGDETISPYYRLAELHKEEYPQNSRINYEFSWRILQMTSWEFIGVKHRLWFHQTCTELGYFRTLSSPVSIFGSRAPLQYFMDQCRDLFGVGFDRDHLDHNIRKIDHLYNSKVPKTTNIIFMNGDLDPWRSLSVLSDLNEDSPAILIDGASHCEFVERSPEKKNIMIATCQVSLMLNEWLHKWLR